MKKIYMVQLDGIGNEKTKIESLYKTLTGKGLKYNNEQILFYEKQFEKFIHLLSKDNVKKLTLKDFKDIDNKDFISYLNETYYISVYDYEIHEFI